MNKILTEDEQLLLSIQSSNRNAYSRLFKKYYPILCAYCHKFVSLEDSEEIVQDVMFWLWESRKQLSFENHSVLIYFQWCVIKHSTNRFIGKAEVKQIPCF